MYVAIATPCNQFFGNDLEKMISYVDNKNNESTYNKYFLIELSDGEYALYRKNKSLQSCCANIVYDPFNVGEKYIKSQSIFSNFVRTFGSRSTDR